MHVAGISLDRLSPLRLDPGFQFTPDGRCLARAGRVHRSFRFGVYGLAASIHMYLSLQAKSRSVNAWTAPQQMYAPALQRTVSSSGGNIPGLCASAATAGVSVLLPAGFTVGADANLTWTGYRTGWWPYVEDGSARKDRTLRLQLSAFNRVWTVERFSPQFSVAHEIRDTNAPLYGFRRTSGEMRFVRRF